MSNLAVQLRNCAIATAVGFSSGLVTCVALVLFPTPAAFAFMGVVFALFMSMYFWWGESCHSVGRTFGFLVVASSAFAVAIFASFLGAQIAGSGEGRYLWRDVFFVSGFLGTFVVVLARLFIVYDSQSFGQLAWKIIAISIFGAILGAASDSISSVVGLQVGRLFQSLNLITTMNSNIVAAPRDALRLYSAFMCWQTFIAPLLVGFFPYSPLRSEVALSPEIS